MTDNTDERFYLATCTEGYGLEVGAFLPITIEEPLVTKNILLHEVYDISPSVSIFGAYIFAAIRAARIP